MIGTQTKRRWPFGSRWAKVSLVVIIVLVCLYLLSIGLQLLVKSNGRGQSGITTSEVQSSLSRTAERRGADVRDVRCIESRRNEWHCDLRLADGRVVSGSAMWRESGHSLGINLDLQK